MIIPNDFPRFYALPLGAEKRVFFEIEKGSALIHSAEHRGGLAHDDAKIEGKISGGGKGEGDFPSSLGKELVRIGYFSILA